jgi:hypothetical protein
MHIERSFGLLKGRFRCCLKGISSPDVSTINDIIAACCTLHNICIQYKCPEPDDIELNALLEAYNNKLPQGNPQATQQDQGRHGRTVAGVPIGKLVRAALMQHVNKPKVSYMPSPTQPDVMHE